MLELYWLATLAGAGWAVLEIIEARRLEIAQKVMGLVVEHSGTLDELACGELSRVATMLAEGQSTEARHRLERLLDDISPDWRAWGDR